MVSASCSGVPCNAVRTEMASRLCTPRGPPSEGEGADEVRITQRDCQGRPTETRGTGLDGTCSQTHSLPGSEGVQRAGHRSLSPQKLEAGRKPRLPLPQVQCVNEQPASASPLWGPPGLRGCPPAQGARSLRGALDAQQQARLRLRTLASAYVTAIPTCSFPSGGCNSYTPRGL